MKRLLLLTASLPPSISIAQSSGIPYMGEDFSLRGLIALFLFVALVVLLDLIKSSLRLEKCSQCNNSKGFSKESVLLSGEQKSYLQEKYPHRFKEIGLSSLNFSDFDVVQTHILCSGCGYEVETKLKKARSNRT
jgi:hypothetical protein